MEYSFPEHVAKIKEMMCMGLHMSVYLYWSFVMNWYIFFLPEGNISCLVTLHNWNVLDINLSLWVQITL